MRLSERSLSSTRVSRESEEIETSSLLGNDFSGASSTLCGWKAKPSAGTALKRLQRPADVLRSVVVTQPSSRRKASGCSVEFVRVSEPPREDIAPIRTWALASAAWILGYAAR